MLGVKGDCMEKRGFLIAVSIAGLLMLILAAITKEKIFSLLQSVALFITSSVQLWISLKNKKKE